MIKCQNYETGLVVAFLTNFTLRMALMHLFIAIAQFPNHHSSHSNALQEANFIG